MRADQTTEEEFVSSTSQEELKPMREGETVPGEKASGSKWCVAVPGLDHAIVCLRASYPFLSDNAIQRICGLPLSPEITPKGNASTEENK